MNVESFPRALYKEKTKLPIRDNMKNSYRAARIEKERREIIVDSHFSKYANLVVDYAIKLIIAQ